MSQPFILNHIRNLPLCKGLSPNELELLASAFEILRLEPEQLLFQQGQISRGMYVFVSGQGALMAEGNPRPMGMVGAGQYINEAALYGTPVESASLRILAPSIVLLLARDKLVALVAQHPELGERLNAYRQTRARPPAAPPLVRPTPPPAPAPAAPPMPAPVTPAPQPAHPPLPLPTPPLSQQPVPAPAAPTPPPAISKDTATFAGQREDEVVLLQTPQHWWAFARHSWWAFALMVGLAALSLIARSALLQGFFCSVAIFVPGLILFYLYREWHNDQLLVTSERLMWIERRIIGFETKITELPIDSILEVSTELPRWDPIARLLNYGTLRLRTSGDAGNLTLSYMPNPAKLQKLIFDDREKHKQGLAQRQRNVLRSEMHHMLSGTKPPATQSSPAPQPASGSFNPLRMKFTSSNGETVYRKHWSVWLQHTILPLVAIAVGIGIALAALFRSDELGLLFLAMSAVPIAGGGVWLYWSDWDWRNDLYIVGDDVITIIHRRPFFLQDKTEKIILAQVDSVATEQSGFFNALLNRGDVRLALEGADASQVKKFAAVFDPRSVQAEVSGRQARARRKVQESQSRQQREAIGDYFSIYHETVNPNAPPIQPHRPPMQQPSNQPKPQDGTRPPNVPPRSKPPRG